MQKKIFLLLAVLFMQNLPAESNHSRFFTALKSYNYPEYKILDRDINLDFNYYNDQTENNQVENNYHDKNTQKSLSGDLSFSFKNTMLKPVYWSDLYIYLSLGGNKYKYETINTHIGPYTTNYSDTSHNSTLNAIARFQSQYVFERHLTFPLLGDLPFFSISGHTTIYADRRREESKNYDPANSISKRWSNRVQENFKIIPEIGFSRRQPVEPIFRAFEIERKLKQAHVISETVSMNTIRKLSTFIASKETYYITHDKYDKYRMKDLGMILHSDSLVDTSRLDAFAYFKVMEALTSNAPVFFCGFRVAVGCVANGNGYSTKGDLYNQSETDSIDTDLRIEVSASYTFPVFRKLFFESELKMSDSTTNKQQFKYKLSKQNVNFKLHYFLTDKILANATLYALPMKYLFPNGDEPQSIGLDLNFYLEDNVSLRLYASKNFRGDDDYNTVGNTTSRSNEQVGLSIHYDF